mgnify:FL=1
MDKKRIEVIIPTYKPGNQLEELLGRLEKQTLLPDRIHIVDTRSGDFPEGLETAERLEESGVPLKVTHIEKENFDHGGTRAMAADMSSADILVFMTQDALPANPYLLQNLCKAFEGEKIGAAYARQLPKKDCRLLERYTRSFNYPKESKIKSQEDLPKLGIKTYFCSNVCAAYRKDVYDSLGGFEERTIFNEDMILAGKIIQSGYRIAYAADAEVFHSHNYSCKQQFKRNFDLAVSQAEHPEIFEEIRSENEGIRLVKTTAGYLFKIRKPWLLSSLFFQSASKYLGYRIGKRYQKLPKWLIRKCTMNREYWS